MLDALQPFFAAAFTLWGAPVTRLEIVAFLLAVAMVVFNIRANPVAWPLAMASSLLYFALFWNSRLYGEANLQLLFIAVAGWGWWQWLAARAPDGTRLHVHSLSTRGRWNALLALAVTWPLIGLFLRRFTDTDVPWWDAFPTAGSIVGQWLLGRKYVENWPAWIVVNVVSVGLFAYKGLWLTVLLYALFIAMSVVGWREWRRIARP